MSGIIDYGLIGGSTPTQTALQVREKMDEGWQPYGAPFSHQGDIVQAVIRERGPGKRIRKSSEDD
jgi:hypothetical protein